MAEYVPLSMFQRMSSLEIIKPASLIAARQRTGIHAKSFRANPASIARMLDTTGCIKEVWSAAKIARFAKHVERDLSKQQTITSEQGSDSS